MGIEELSVFSSDMIEMTKAETQEMTQALPLDRSDPSFGKRVGVRRQ
ncbi:MAG TPA: hypothetical protein VJZ71_16400 [Phycisphaerae bacterium]|nr:hypothetical protein [Phycisphaerae bacterium]